MIGGYTPYKYFDDGNFPARSPDKPNLTSKVVPTSVIDDRIRFPKISVTGVPIQYQDEALDSVPLTLNQLHQEDELDESPEKQLEKKMKQLNIEQTGTVPVGRP